MTMSKATGGVIWLTGLPASGKSALGKELSQVFAQRELPHLWLDSDDLRQVMTPHPSYSPEERDVFYRTLGRVALRAAEGGVLTVVSATAPRQRYRDELRQQAPHFIEVLLTCDLETLHRRDPKGLYARAAAGEIHELPGVDAPYEAPPDPELTLDTSAYSPKELVDRLVRWLDGRGLAGLPVADPTHL